VCTVLNLVAALDKWSATLPLSDYGRIARQPFAIKRSFVNLCFAMADYNRE
jgi:hypothetical protein